MGQTLRESTKIALQKFTLSKGIASKGLPSGVRVALVEVGKDVAVIYYKETTVPIGIVPKKQGILEVPDLPFGPPRLPKIQYGIGKQPVDITWAGKGITLEHIEKLNIVKFDRKNTIYHEILDGLEPAHFILDLGGNVPVFGEPLDVLNGALYSAEGKVLDAGISFASVVVVGGFLLRYGKHAKKAGRVLNSVELSPAELRILDDGFNPPFGAKSHHGPGRAGGAGGLIPNAALRQALESEANWTLHQPLPGMGSGVHPNLPFRNGQRTEGIFVHNGIEVPLQSLEHGPGQWLTSNLQGLNFQARQAAMHVEGHAAGIMQRHGIMDADVYLNYVGGPCPTYCQPTIHQLLPQGATLRVHFPKPDDTVGIWQFTGGTPGYSVIQ